MAHMGARFRLNDPEKLPFIVAVIILCAIEVKIPENVKGVEPTAVNVPLEIEFFLATAFMLKSPSEE